MGDAGGDLQDRGVTPSVGCPLAVPKHPNGTSPWHKIGNAPFTGQISKPASRRGRGKNTLLWSKKRRHANTILGCTVVSCSPRPAYSRAGIFEDGTDAEGWVRL
jgi:hypothetical protein